MNTLEKQAIAERVITRFIKSPPAAMYDIGVGLKTEAQTLKKVYPSMEVIGIEPNPRRVTKALLDGFPGKIFPVAVGSGESLWLKFTENGSLEGDGTTSEGFQEGPGMYVSTMSLDDLDVFAKNPESILLWMDIEGFELNAMRTGSRLLNSKRVKWLNLEIRQDPPTGWCSAAQVDDFLRKKGYKKLLEYNKHVSHCDVIYGI